MTNFDELCTIRRIVELYRERGKEMTHPDVKRYANQICRKSELSVEDAYEAIESELLDRPPPKLPPWPKREGR